MARHVLAAAKPGDRVLLRNIDRDGLEPLIDAGAEWTETVREVAEASDIIIYMVPAIAHIREHTTGHSETIVTRDLGSAERFVAEVDAAAVLVNASSRFVDGGEFGFGAEIGISTQKLHARGPMALPEMTSTKYVLTGTGQVRG